HGPMLATLIRLVGDFDLAEDSLQDAYEAAVENWPRDGTPREPARWLISTARHKAIDRLRHEALTEHNQERLELLAANEEEGPVPLDTLRLVFTCCHPALASDAQVALTLKTIGGLTTDEIAKAFLTPPATLAQRLVRAKAKIKDARIPYEVPHESNLIERLEPVLATIYLVFNEGYSASFGGEIIRTDLCAEAVHLGRLLVELLPKELEAKGLLALMLFHDARRPTRTDANGDLVLLENQDRSRWNGVQIEEAARLVDQALRRKPLGRYAVEAAIAGLHAQAPTAASTDWRQIAALYSVLIGIHATPVAALNRAIAIAMADGLERGLELLNTINIPGYHLLPAARADLLRRLGRLSEAASAYREALALVTNDAERRFLERRLAQAESN
ncbi:MAG: RNA polymerase sigma factor, partial [Polyangiaceae bacterium]